MAQSGEIDAKGRNSKGKVALFNFQDKDIFFPCADVARALRQYVAKHGIAGIYIATNRLSELPQYEGNGTDAPLFSFSTAALMEEQLRDEFPGVRWDNFLVSLVEQEVAYQAEHFLGSVRSTWSDNVIWWRGANPQKAATTGGVVEAIYGSLGWKWSGQIHDERVLDRKEVQGGLVHKGWKEKRDALVQQHNRAYRKQRDQAQRGDGDGGGDGEDGGEDGAEDGAEDEAPACRDNDEAAQMAAKSFGIEIASCAAGKKMGLCAEPAAKEVCALSCGECEAAQ